MYRAYFIRFHSRNIIIKSAKGKQRMPHFISFEKMKKEDCESHFSVVPKILFTVLCVTAVVFALSGTIKR